ncbi:MAG: ABC transporter ATP-binding protein [Ancalomicrobiaceae bacterium]|nr:ABC transporter ATP-binding protein [Ancalomicrobiaceae bacterium]
MTSIRIESIVKRFDDVTALDGVSLDLPSGSFTALLGASGCGKTTLLRLIAGFEHPSAGRILFDGEPVCDERAAVPPESRNVGVVFQSYALWPHLTVADNVAYPLRSRGTPRRDIAPKVAAALAAVGLHGLADRSPDALSGGQRQRVALARCLVAEARIIVFDEPLANLDVHLRAAMVDAFRDLHRRTGTTIVYVTHDQGEALALADRIAVMDRGRIAQFATPRTLYAAPQNRLIAEFVGRGRVLTGQADGPGANGRTRVRLGGAAFEARTGGTDVAGPVAVLLRPESLRLADDGIPARIRSVTYRGPTYELELAMAEGAGSLVVDTRDDPPAIATEVNVAVDDAWIVPEG